MNQIDEKTVYIFFASGFEEIEAITPVDILRRAGVNIKMISVTNSKTVMGAHNIEVQCDCLLEDILQKDLPAAIIMPGGMPGATNLANNQQLKDFTIKCFNAKKLVCAICASPAIVFGSYGLLKNKNWTCYPNMETEASKEAQATWKTEPVVIDGNLITSRGPGTASVFAYSILSQLNLDDKAQNLKKGMLF